MPLDITQEKIEQFIAGQLGEEGETEFLKRIVSSNERSETERILAKVQMIQGDLNTRLRQGVRFIFYFNILLRMLDSSAV